ncbi:non-ribosomal peptide synthetase [Xenorhabdus griffiniae]|uniref:non-ribosomal peptide synthetase n=1 Tax=Xenorhabdus griffiniae TaxID=351672 RepID=UPI00235A1B68|nr:non-ribosomal peptide synthetase [Xenorhabdus griffiniae]MDC9605744.1 non-ribosomal peptide synthetase [Xenorhabdus griffiniae]
MLNKLINNLSENQNKIAIIDDYNHFSYKELNSLVKNIGQLLQSIDELNSRSAFITVFLPGGYHFVASVLAVIFSGHKYIPLDPNMGAQRLQHIYKQTNCLVITMACYQHLVPDDLQFLILDESYPHTAWLPQHRQENECLYTIFTSGTTGTPKGAQVHLGGFTNVVNWYIEELTITGNDVILIPSSVSFDLTQKNIFAALVTGACLVFPSLSPFDPISICQKITQFQVTKFNCTPSTLSLLSDTGQLDFFNSLNTIVLGGEQVSKSVIQLWLSKNPKIKFMNSYGPTECSDVVCFCWITETMLFSKHPIPIGHAIPNTALTLLETCLDEDNLEIGEIVVTGKSVGLGYINATLNTSFKLKTNPRSYRTGDLGYFHQAFLYYKGRTDRQIKYNGSLVNLTEIEHCLLTHPAIINAYVSLYRDNNILVAWYQLKRYETITVDQIQFYLKNQLPKYMQPSMVIPKNIFPLNYNNKVDGNQLIKELDATNAEIKVFCNDSVSDFLYDSIKKITGKSIFSSSQPIAMLGMNSLQMIQFLNRINRKYDLKMMPREFVSLNTLEDVVNLINKLQREGDNSDYIII